MEVQGGPYCSNIIWPIIPYLQRPADHSQRHHVLVLCMGFNGIASSRHCLAWSHETSASATRKDLLLLLEQPPNPLLLLLLLPTHSLCCCFCTVPTPSLAHTTHHRDTFMLLKSKFDIVAFVPGNHELWVRSIR